MADAQKRRKLIRELVAKKKVETQIELVEMLKTQGIDSTQASISRDIAALGLIKVGGAYSLPGAPVNSNIFKNKLIGRIHSVRQAGDSLIVLRTDPGDATAVALALDHARWEPVVGTVAGDDTVFVACDGPSANQQVIKMLKNLVPEAFH